MLYRVPVAGSVDRLRTVCKSTFLAHYPVSLATLKRIVLRKRLGEELYSKLSAGPDRLPVKSLHAISWWISYAEQVSVQ